ncbi:zinc finger protein 26-like isoform X16 [Cydia strobilella]|uniref:zinc finger protein 26-like isoform X16 n=1 Tax=Cydia strobilella TaxID=1100964 RepID=UPI0030055B98
MEGKSTDWVRGPSGPTVCRCCFTEGCYKDISTEYFWMGKREVYCEMLTETFDLSIAFAQTSGPNSNSRLICEPCISRLRDASEFKRQVQECEKMFMQYLDPGRTTVDELQMETTQEPLEKGVKLEPVKLEKNHSDDDFDDRGGFDDMDEDDLDDQPLTRLASKVPKKESVDLLDLLDNAKAEKRKSSTKTKSSPAKKAKTKKETPKATASKAKPEKKKKETGEISRFRMAKRNAEVILQYSTVYPFRLRSKSMFCLYCDDEFEDPAMFRAHAHECQRSCKDPTSFAYSLRNQEHIKVECTNMGCRVCVIPFNSIEEMVKHIYDNHDSSKLNLDFDTGLQPYRLEQDKWFCFLCAKKFPSLTKLGRHTPTHYRKCTCEICGRAYLTKEALKYHVRCSHGDNFSCRKCWQEFPSMEEKRFHIRNSKPCWSFCCVYCGERFLSWENKQKHLTEAHDRPSKNYSCPECSITFDSRKLFYSHYKLNHTDEIFPCTCCGLKFGSKRALEDHTISHTGEKHFKCIICLKAFSRRKSLKQHMWLHSETKRFSCLACDKTFAQKISLKGHMKSHHADYVVNWDVLK